MKLLTIGIAVALMTVGAYGSPAGAIAGAIAAPDDESGFVQAINQIRTSRGLSPLSLDGELSAIARTWSFTMAAAGEISHRPDLRAGVTSEWTALGENVGVGPDVANLMDAFVASPGHYKNLVDPRFTHVGVGAVRAGGLIFTAHEFMAVSGAGGGSAPPPAPTTQTTVRAQAAPRPVTTAAPRRTPTPTPAPAARPVESTPAAPLPAPAQAVTPPPAPTATPRVIAVLDRLRGNPPTL